MALKNPEIRVCIIYRALFVAVILLPPFQLKFEPGEAPPKCPVFGMPFKAALVPLLFSLCACGRQCFGFCVFRVTVKSRTRASETSRPGIESRCSAL